MTEKGVAVLKALINRDLVSTVDFIVIGKDPGVQNDFSNDLEDLCKKNRIRHYTRQDTFQVRSEYAVAVSWRWIIQVPGNTRLIVLHDSLLPKYRGFAPLVNSLINGEKEIGVTAIFASSEYDKGDIIDQKSIPINYPIKIHEAIEKISGLYVDLSLSLVRKINENKEIPARQQNDAEASYSLWRDEDDYLIDWSENARDILRFIHAVGYPYKGAACFLAGEKIRIQEASILPDVRIEIRTPGKNIFYSDNYPVIVCGKGLLKITEATYDKDGKSIFPLKKFRIKLQPGPNHTD